MRIGCLQFAPQVGDVNNNLNRADSVLNRANPEDLDLLVLPELAFSGYNFKSLREIFPHLEPPGSGVSSLWARTTALKYDCTVFTGYPEKVDVTDRWPTSPEYYNSVIGVSKEGETVVNYRKSQLYYTDETWALEGPDGFYAGRLPGLGRTAMGICMDINPYKFQTPWETYEFANHTLECGARLVILSMAWLTNAEPREFSRSPQEPDLETLMYWISRFEPVIQANSTQEVIIVIANRTGTEDDATYAGTSAVVGIKDGEVLVYGLLGRGDKELLVVDTEAKPFARLVHHSRSSDVPVSSADSPTTGNEPMPSHGRAGNADSNGHSSNSSNSPLPKDAPIKENRAEQFGNSEVSSSHAADFSLFADSQDHEQVAQQVRQRRANNSSNPQFVSRNDPELLYGRSVAVAQTPEAGKTRTRSSSMDSLSSMESSRLYLMPQPQADGTHRGEEPASRFSDGDDISSPDYERENRHSLRSDFSLWNDRADISVAAQQQMSSRRVEDYLRSSTFESSSHVQSNGWDKESPPLQRDQSRIIEDGQPPAKIASRGAPHRSSAKRRASKIERHASAHELTVGNTNGATFSPGRRQRETSSQINQREVTPISSAFGFGDAVGPRASSISIAMAPEISHNAQRSATKNHVGEAPHRTANGEPPILRPASRSRLRGRSDSERRHEAEPSSSSNSIPRHHRKSSNSPAVNGTRHTSRGRERSSRQALRRQQSSDLGHHRRGSRTGSRAEGGDVDLSQYNLIEEYRSAECPVHGSRSNSAAHDRPGSRRRESASRRNRPASRDQREPRHGSRDSPGPAISRTATSQYATQTSTRSKPAKKQSQDQLIPRSMTQSVQIGVRDRNPKAEEKSRAQQVTITEGSVLDWQQGPKTPKAMVLLSEVSNPVEEPLESQPIQGTNVVLVSRPRSAVW